MNKISALIFSSLIFLNILNISAQKTVTAKQSFFDSLTRIDSTNGASVKIFQDKRIENFVNEKNNLSSYTTGSGYRLQVFSSNEQKTGKSEAFKIEKEIREAFPELPVYVNYFSPFWKVRVGDFDSREQAKVFRNELLKIFPNLKNETYTIKDK
jgi:hypothetical protein